MEIYSDIRLEKIYILLIFNFSPFFIFDIPSYWFEWNICFIFSNGIFVFLKKRKKAIKKRELEKKRLHFCNKFFRFPR